MSKIPDLPKTRAFAKNPTYENWKVLPTAVQNFMLMQANSSNLKRNKEFMQVVDDNRDAYKHIDKLEKILESVVQSIDKLSSVQLDQALDTKNKIDQIMSVMNTFEQKTAKEDVMEVIKSLDAKIEQKFSQYVSMINNKQTLPNPDQIAVIDEQTVIINSYKQRIDEQESVIFEYEQQAKSYNSLNADLTSKLDAAYKELSQVNSLYEMAQAQNSPNTSSQGFDGMKYNLMNVSPYYKNEQEAFNKKVEELKKEKNDINEAIRLSNEFITRYQNLESPKELRKLRSDINTEISKYRATNKTIYNVCTAANKKIFEANLAGKEEKRKQKDAADKKEKIVRQQQKDMQEVANRKAKEASEAAAKVAQEEAAEEEAKRRQAAEEEAKRRQAAEEEAKRRQVAEEEAKKRQAAEEEAKKKEEAKQAAAAKKVAEEDKKRQAADAKKVAEEDKKRRAAAAKKVVEAKKKEADDEEARNNLAAARKVALAEAQDKARREAKEEAGRLALEDAKKLASDEAKRLADEAKRLAAEQQLLDAVVNLEAASEKVERDLNQDNTSRRPRPSKAELRKRITGRITDQKADTERSVKDAKDAQAEIRAM